MTGPQAVTDHGDAVPALFEPADGYVVPTEHCRGPWDHGFLHGGPVCGLVARVAERAIADETSFCARLTVELLVSVPLAPLRVASAVVKEGRRLRVVDVTVHHGDRLVARGSSQWVTAADPPSPDTSDPRPPPLPTVAADPDSGDLDYPRPGFNCDATEVRIVSGSTEESGPGVMWYRLRSSLLAGEPTSPFVTVATLADLAAATGWEHAASGASLVNTDVTLQLSRLPAGPWICLDAANETAGRSIGFNHAVVYDRAGPVGRILQTLVESPIQLGHS